MNFGIKSGLVHLTIVAPMFGVLIVSAQSQTNISSSEVVKALAPAKTSATRSLIVPDDNKTKLGTDDRVFLQNIPTRGLSFDGAQRVEKILEDTKLPKLDIEIRFDFGSAEIKQSSQGDLKALGEALLHPSLINSRILLNGHTDAKGDNAYNLKLSKQRAIAVRQFLITNFKVHEQRLVAIGVGEKRLKDLENPESERNRRVEVISIGS